MKAKFLTLAILAGSSLFAAPFGPPPPPRAAYARPAAPGPNYAWINGYYEPFGRDYRWREGYWAPRPAPHATWVAPRYSGHRYYPGYWRR